MRTIAEIRKYIQLNRHELTRDNLEQLEARIIEIENEEAKAFELGNTPLQPELDQTELYNRIFDIIPHRSRMSDKACYAWNWVRNLQPSDQVYVTEHFQDIYKKHTAEQFRLGRVF